MQPASASGNEVLAPVNTPAAAITKQRVERSDNYLNLSLHNKWVSRSGSGRTTARVISDAPNADGDAVYVVEVRDRQQNRVGSQSYTVDPTGIYLRRIVLDSGTFNNDSVDFDDPLKYLPPRLEAGATHKVGGEVTVRARSLTSRVVTGTYSGQVIVRGFQNVTVPAGTFRAAKIEMTLNVAVNTPISGRNLAVQVTYTESAWLAEGVGPVKSQVAVVATGTYAGRSIGRQSANSSGNLIRHAATRGGLTILTHDIDKDSAGWASAAATGIADRADATRPGSIIYRLGFNNQTNTATGLVKVSGPVESSKSHNGQVVVMIDWSSPDPSHAGTNIRSLASAVAGYLNTQKPAWMDKYVHMIGHGRGATLNSLLAHRLRKVAVTDHFTSLDPLKVGKAFDPAIRIGGWIDFADNYYREDSPGSPDPLDVDGVSVNGANNVMLVESRLENGGHDAEHDDVPLWYLGTITNANTSDGTAVQGRGWYNRRLKMGPRTKVGFNIVQHTVYTA